MISHELSPSAAARGYMGARMGGHWLALPLDRLCEIIHPPSLAWIPGVTPWVLGIASYQASVITVLDLRLFLSAVPSELGPGARVLVLKAPFAVGLLIEDIQGPVSLESEPAETGLTPLAGTPVLQGVAQGFDDIDGERWWRVDFDGLLSLDAFKHGVAPHVLRSA